jgi:hypothetical protein
MQTGWLTSKARLSGRAFACDALSGRSQINVCINSDLTVSCSCRDFDGTGHVADLKTDELADAFYGPVASDFRHQLASGTLPTTACARCWDLRMVSRDEARRQRDDVKFPEFIMVENTSACNLTCVSCPRHRIQNIRGRRSMSLDDVRKVAQELHRVGIREAAYLNLGEPFLSRRLAEELEIIRAWNPGIKINTSTNGVFVATERQRAAALLFDHIQFSLDGINQETAARYQRKTNFAQVYENIKQLVAYRDERGLTRPRIVWKYLLFRWNERRHQMLTAVDMAREANVDELWFERTVSPFYGLPWRSYLGLNRDIGEEEEGARRIVFREAEADERDVAPTKEPVALEV